MKNINWTHIKKAHESENITNVALAKLYGITESTIRKRAIKEGWQKYKSNKTKTKLDNGYLFIDDEAKKQFEKTKSQLSDKITVLDEPLLVALCNQSSRYTKLERKVMIEGETILSTKGVPYLNPTYNALLSTIKTLSTLSKEFGLTIASRKRVGVEINNKEDDSNSIFNLINNVMDSDIV